MWMRENNQPGPFHGPGHFFHGNPRLKPGATCFRRIRGGGVLRAFATSAAGVCCDSLAERAQRVAPRFSVGYEINPKPFAVKRRKS